MAHKKGAGSSKNGRESHSKRLGIKSSVVNKQSLVTSSYANAVHNTILTQTLVLVKTTHCSL